MQIRIDSDVLNRFACVGSADIIPIYLNNDPRQTLGTCNIFFDKTDGHIYADMELKDGLDLNLYVYYYNSINFNGWCEIENIGLHTERRSDKDTSILKDLIIKKV